MKLNLGCGENHKPGYCNVDKFGNPDIKHDLEIFPWPWDDNGINEIRMNHVFEHLGERLETFYGIIKEIYRICRNGAKIEITVPHPRHDDFISDPSHVRMINERTFELFSKRLNRQYVEAGATNSLLAAYLDVDLETKNVKYGLEKEWAKLFNTGKISIDQLNDAKRKYNNVIKEIQIVLEVIK